MSPRAFGRAVAGGLAAFAVLCPERALAEVADVRQLPQELAAPFDEAVAFGGRHVRLLLYLGKGNRNRGGTTAFLNPSNPDVHPRKVRTLPAGRLSDTVRARGAGDGPAGARNRKRRNLTGRGADQWARTGERTAARSPESATTGTEPFAARPPPPGPAARARLACLALPCAVALAVMSPTAARAQVHVSNDVAGNFFVDGPTQGSASSESTLHLAQPFTTPSGSGGIPLRNVVLHFTSMPLSLGQVKLYLYRAKANPNPTSPPAFAPTVPDSGTVDSTTNEPAAAGRLAEFATPVSLGGGRYRFAAPANTALDAATTYHLYLWSVANLTGPEWRSVDITRTPGGAPGDAGFTGHNSQCPPGGWALLRGLSADVRNPGGEGWIPDGNGRLVYVTEIVGEPNHTPSGSPAIAGTQTIGETLTAGPGDLADLNGALSSFVYEWFRTDADGTNSQAIPGATSPTYTPTEDDEGRRLRVQVTFTDADCYEQTTSVLAANTFAEGLALEAEGGTAQVGKTLTAETGGIADADGLPSSPAFTYRWTRVDADGVSNPEDIAGATSRTYTPVEADEGKRVRVTVGFADSDGHREAVGALSAPIAERAPAVITVAAGGSVTEGAPAIFTLTRTEELAIALAVEVTVSETGDMVAAGDKGTRTVTFGAGATTATLEVPTADDSAVEPDSTVTVAVQDGDGYVPGTPSEAEVVAEDDDPAVTVAAGGNVTEGAPAIFTLTRTRDTAIALAVEVTVSETGDMVAAGDKGTRTVTFAAGAATAALEVPTADDDADEPDSTVTVVVEDGGAYDPGTPSEAGVVARDNDGPPVVTVAAGGNVTEGAPARFTLIRTKDPAAGLAVEVTVSETGDMVAAGDEGTRTVTFGAGAATAALEVPTVDDSEREPDSTVTVAVEDGGAYDRGTPSEAGVVASDNDHPVVTVAADGDVTEGAPASFTLTRAGDISAALEVEVAVSETGDMVAAGDEGTRTVTFAAGVATAALAVPTVDDSADEPDSTVTVAVADGDAYDPGTPSTAAVVVADEDEPAVVTVAAGGDVTEGAAANFTLTRTGDAATALAVEVAVSETGDMVATGDKGTRTVTFGAGAATAALAVPTVDDSADEPDSTVTVAVADGGAYDRGTPSEAGVVVADNDEPAPSSVVTRRTKATTYNLSAIGRAVTKTVVNRVWDRAARLDSGDVPSFATVGGRVVDAGALADARRVSGAVAGLFGAGGAPGSARGAAADFHAPDAGGYRDLKRGLLPDARSLLGRTRFELRPGGAGSGATGSLAVWGRGDFTAFETRVEDDDIADFSTEGEVFSGHVGVDYRPGPGFLAGIAAGHSRGEASYAFADRPGVRDDMKTTLSSVHPYLHWMPSRGLRVWGTVGYGTGTATIVEDAVRTETDLTMRTVGGGARSEISRLDGTEVAVKADAFLTEIEADAAGGGRTLAGTTAEASRMRAAVEGVRRWALEEGDSLSGTLDLGVRMDGGDAGAGAGADVAGELRYAAPRDGLEVALRGGALLVHEADGVAEWGLGLQVVYDPGVPGRGVRLALGPAWNVPRSGVAEAMWNADAGSGVRSGASPDRGGAVVARLGYGTVALRGRALATAFGEAGGDGDGARLRLGTELRPAGAGRRFGLGIHWERRDLRAGPEHALGMRLGLEF